MESETYKIMEKESYTLNQLVSPYRKLEGMHILSIWSLDEEILGLVKSSELTPC